MTKRPKRRELVDYLVILVVLMIVASVATGCGKAGPYGCKQHEAYVLAVQECLQHSDECKMRVSDYEQYHMSKFYLTERCDVNIRKSRGNY